MVAWKCNGCDYSKESRCKPRVCPECGKKEFVKAGEAGD